MTTQTAFRKVTRPGDPDGIWMRKDAPVWIVYYNAVPGIRPAFYEAYRAIHPVPAHRQPWSIDNRRLSDGNGFPTLAAAKQAALKVQP